MNTELKELNRLLNKGIIESEKEFDLYMSLHEESYYKNERNTSVRSFKINLEEGYCEITVNRSKEQVSKNQLAFMGFYWQNEPIHIHFFDIMELEYDSYYDLKWSKVIDESVLFNYKLVGRVCTVRQLRAMSLDYMVWTRPAYNRQFLQEGKMILNTYIIDGELRVLYIYFHIIDDCNVSTDSLDDLSEVRVEITHTKLSKGGSYEHLIQAS